MKSIQVKECDIDNLLKYQPIFSIDWYSFVEIQDGFAPGTSSLFSNLLNSILVLPMQCVSVQSDMNKSSQKSCK